MRAQQPSITNQNATQEIYIKGIKWLGNPYRHTVLKCSMKMYLKGSTSTHDRNAKTSPAHTHTCKQEQTLINSTTIHKNNKQN